MHHRLQTWPTTANNHRNCSRSPANWSLTPEIYPWATATEYLKTQSTPVSCEVFAYAYCLCSCFAVLVCVYFWIMTSSSCLIAWPLPVFDLDTQVMFWTFFFIYFFYNKLSYSTFASTFFSWHMAFFVKVAWRWTQEKCTLMGSHHFISWLWFTATFSRLLNNTWPQ